MGVGQRVFISHREVDAKLAKSLIDVLVVGTPIDGDRILCTSVAGHKLQYGKTIATQLRQEIQNKPIFVALLTQNALKSSWVTFELGAAWAMNVTVIPILGRGVAFDEVPAALKDYPGISADSTASEVRASVAQVLDQIRTQIGVKKPNNSARVSAVIDQLIDEFAKTETAVVASVQSADASNLFPSGYTKVRTPVGGVGYKSVGDPAHYACTVC